jgi:hypothetical protein
LDAENARSNGPAKLAIDSVLPDSGEPDAAITPDSRSTGTNGVRLNGHMNISRR